MSDERKPRLHINIGLLIIITIIVLILFKVDIKSKIKSPQFQENITYVEGQFKNTWQKYIGEPIREKLGKYFVDLTNKKIKQIQDNFTENVLKTPTVEDIEKASNL